MVTTTKKFAVKPASPAAKKSLGTAAPLQSAANPTELSIRVMAKTPPEALDKTKTEKTSKSKTAKLVRDRFAIPKIEYAILGDLKYRSENLARPAKKSELLRAGIKALAAMSEADFLSALDALPQTKTKKS
jgi:hypothetical protein